MDCPQAREWLLQADDTRPERCASAEVAEHLQNCVACRSFAAELTQLEQDWRNLPLPAAAETARQEFVAGLPQASSTAGLNPAARQSSRAVRWAVAALVLIGVGVAVWSLYPTPQAVAAPVLIEKLIDWNLELAQAESAAERERIYARQEATFTKAIRKSNLSKEDRKLAGLLMESGISLAQASDPMGQAEVLSEVDDQLVERLQTAAQGRNQEAVDRFAKLHGKVSKRGVEARMAKLHESSALDFEHERRLEKIVLRDSKRMQTLIDLLERNPDISRKEIRQELNLPSKSPKGPAGLHFDLEGKENPAIGETVRYRVKLHNEGSKPLHKLQVVVTLPKDAEMMEAHGPTTSSQEGQQVIFRQLEKLAPGKEATFDVNVKPLHQGEFKVRAELRTKQQGYRPLLRDLTATVQPDVP
jgi:uncharacterized repeat protein (TIGR01451 family)